VRLDVTDPAQIAAAADLVKDVTLLVNNAGTQSYQRLVDGDLDAIRIELETILFGPLQPTRAFAPHLARNGGGAILNVLSAMSWFGYDGGNGYFLAKAAGWAATNGLRLELAKQKTQVTGVHIGVIDADLSASWPGAKLDPIDVANIALDGVEAGAAEVLADDRSRTVKAYLRLDPAEAYQRISTDLAAMATPVG
jgi:NAD(P)-dependent dehydrogenase (short-subunit alcohol dehydrogenase family)